MISFHLAVMSVLGQIKEEQRRDADMYLHNITDVVNKHNFDKCCRYKVASDAFPYHQCSQVASALA